MSRSREILTLAAVLLPIVAMLSCAGQKSISPDQIHSRIRSANSLLTETDMLIDFVRANRVTRNYAQGHASYLRDEARELASELQKSRAEQGAQVAADECRSQLERLVHELSSIPVGIANDNAFAESKARLADIRQQLLHADSSL
jgi:hypothetical protein